MVATSSWKGLTLLAPVAVLLLAILIGLAVLGQSGLPKQAGLTVIPLLIGIAAFVWISARSLRRDKPTWRLLVVLFLLQLIITLVLNQFWWWPQSADQPDSGNDWDRYERFGWELAQGGLDYQSISGLPLEEVGTTVYVAIVYAIFGRNPASLAVFHTLLLALTGLQIYHLAGKYGGFRLARYAAVMWALLPIALLHSAFPSKDIPVVFVFVALNNWLEDLLITTRSKKAFAGRPLTFMVLGMIVLATLRYTMLVVFLGLAIIRVWLWLRQGAGRRAYRGPLALVVVSITIAVVLYGRETVTERVNSFSPITIEQLAATLSTQFTDTADSSLAFRTYWNGDWSRAYLVPLRVPLTLYAPFPPLDFSDIYQGMLSVNAWILILALPATLGAFLLKKESVRRRISLLAPCWLPVLGVGAILSAGLPFIQPRYALPAYPYLVVLTMIGLEQWKSTRRLYGVFPIVVFMMFGLYFILKS